MNRDPLAGGENSDNGLARQRMAASGDCDRRSGIVAVDLQLRMTFLLALPVATAARLLDNDIGVQAFENTQR